MVKITQKAKRQNKAIFNGWGNKFRTRVRFTAVLRFVFPQFCYRFPVQVFKRRALNLCLTAVVILLLNACSSPTPPTEFAPEGEVIQKAILLQLNQTVQLLSQQLNASDPEIDISKIKVNTLEPIYVAELPAYHLQGTYNLKLTLPHQQITQKNNRFEIYLQRQAEAKTWRLLRRDITPSSSEPQWSSYLIR